MAPSSTRMRSAARRRSVVSAAGVIAETSSHSLPCRKRKRSAGCDVRANTEQVADREHEIGAVHSVEVEIGDAVIDEVEHLFGGDRGGDELARRRIVVEAFEALGEPGRHGSTTARG